MVESLDQLIEFLPQRAPFLFVDGVETWEPGVRVVGSQTFPTGHPIFENHLPGDPIVPGVIALEALAQLSAILLLPPDPRPDYRIKGYLAGIQRMRFRRLMRPDERIVLRSTLERVLGTAARFEVQAEVEGESAVDGLITVGGVEAG